MNEKALKITEKLEQMIYSAGHYYVSNVEPNKDEQFSRIIAFATGYTVALQDVIEGVVDINVTPTEWLGEDIVK